MYTRSYRTPPQAVSRPLPPDYSGTALVIAQPSEPSLEALTVKPPPRVPRFSDRRSGSVPPQVESRRAAIRRETLSPAPPPLIDRDPLAAPPFGGQGQPNATAPTAAEEIRHDADIPASASAPEEASPLGRLFDPANLKSDDLLLLGLILLFISEGEENGKDALLLLAALYVAG